MVDTDFEKGLALGVDPRAHLPAGLIHLSINRDKPRNTFSIDFL